MEKNITQARKNCALALSPYYPKLGILADMFDGEQYRGYWQTPAKTVIEILCDDVFDKNSYFLVSELHYVKPQLNHFSGLSLAH